MKEVNLESGSRAVKFHSRTSQTSFIHLYENPREDREAGRAESESVREVHL